MILYYFLLIYPDSCLAGHEAQRETNPTAPSLTLSPTQRRSNAIIIVAFLVPILAMIF